MVLRIESNVFVAGITGREITDFLLHCTDEQYQRWWPGTHLQFHALVQHRDHIGDVVVMDEFIGKHRVKLTGVVTEAVPGRRLVVRMKRWVVLPVWLTIDLTERNDGVALRHVIRAGYGGIGRVLDPVFRLHFSRTFAAAMDDHVRTEFPLLRDHLHGTRHGAP